MQQNFRVAPGSRVLFLLVTAAAAFCLVGCGGNRPDSPVAPSTSVPAAQMLYRDGFFGNWFGNALTAQAFYQPAASGTLTVTNATATDNINGDATCLWLSSAACAQGVNCTQTSPGMNLICSLGQNASGYSMGHLQFDIQLNQTMTGSLQIYYGATGSGSYSTECLYSMSLTTLNDSTFTHLSIPIADFSPNGTASVNQPIYLNFDATIAGGGVAYINAIEWTAN